jgi:Cdc6-like AAA superfamily ATPase
MRNMQSGEQLAAEHLERECRWIDLLLHRQVLRTRALRDQAPDRFRGLYIADAQVDELLAEADDTPTAEKVALLTGEINAQREANDACLVESPHLPLALLRKRFGLSRREVQILLIALAPELDLRFMTLYAYTQNDVTRKIPTIDLTLKLLCDTREEQWSARTAFSVEAALFSNALVWMVEEPQEKELPRLARSIRIAERVAGFLLGQDAVDPHWPHAFATIEPRDSIDSLVLPEAMKRRLAAAAPLLKDGGTVALLGRPGSGKSQVAAAVCSQLGRKLVVCDLSCAGISIDLAGLLTLLRRECLLQHAGLYFRMDDGSSPEHLRVFSGLVRDLRDQAFPVFLGMAQRSDAPLLPWSVTSLHFELEVPEISVRRSLWQRQLNGSATATDIESELDNLAGKFRFTPGQISEVVTEAHSLARLRSTSPESLKVCDVYQAARAHSSPGLEKLARKSDLPFDWQDLVLPDRVLQQLKEVVNSVRLRSVVHSAWRFDRKVGRHTGISVLFAGLSGTGKTMSASVLARELNLDLYKIDLSSVVSKYIGETEKNLNRIFDEAEYASAILFFDEADALFGKRSEVKDAHDRYSNIEVAFLLQRIEQFSGLAILATNISRNIDAAFVRRLQHIVEFPFPDAVLRERIWRGMFPEEAPVDADVDFEFLARQFEFSGGNIRNAVMGAAFLAAEEGRPIAMQYLTRAIGRELQKMGKLPSKADFREHFASISSISG